MPVSQPQNKNLTSKMKVQGGKTLAYTLVLNPNFLRKLGHSAPLQCKQVATFPQTCEKQRSLIFLPLTAGIISSTI